jgi:hypothetical protein
MITLKPITQLALYCKQTFAEINIYLAAGSNENRSLRGRPSVLRGA